jgi:hypothetical protein
MKDRKTLIYSCINNNYNFSFYEIVDFKEMFYNIMHIIVIQEVFFKYIIARAGRLTLIDLNLTKLEFYYLLLVKFECPINLDN